jgi:Ca2+-binding EF-hand superfamily protein
MRKVDPRRALKLALIPAACAALFSGCASFETKDTVVRSEPVVESPVTLFDRYDMNRDGFLSRSEVETLGIRAYAASDEAATKAFHRLDTNGDGFLSRAEVETTLGGIPGASFAASDNDRNGFLSLTEALPHLRWLESRGMVSFDTFDTNRDGFISRGEAEPLWKWARVVDGRTIIVMPMSSFDRLDTNRDGFLSRGEAASIAASSTFDRHDGNRDGFLSRGEAEPLFGVGGTAATYGGTVYGPR